jgi:3'(2'), 5'-bisphosphate nucleotidase
MKKGKIRVTPGPEHRDAARIATAAGDALLALRRRLQSNGGDMQAIRAAGDHGAHQLIVRALAAAYPHDPILSEEGADGRARLGSRRVWIVDPLDGTREFGEVERTDWAVHVALIVDGTPVAGAVALPARRLTLSTLPPPRLAPRVPGAVRIVVSRTRPPAVALALAARLQAELVPLGSAGAKTMAVVLGEADVYVHAGGQYEWDSAAPVAVAAAAGLHVSRLDGTALRYNQPDPWLPDQMICRPELATEVLDALKTVCAA